jgi:RNA methyltransferase, TrmH family
MAQTLSPQNARIRYARDLLTNRGREQHSAFAFEGGILLAEALRSGLTPDSLFVTADAYETSATVRELDASGTPTYVVGDRTFAKISDVTTPTGILAIAAQRLRTPAQLFAPRGLYLILADISDPGNAGTLLRSAEGFGAAGVIFGSEGVDPYHPKVVRAAMGASFRLPLALVDLAALGVAAGSAGVALVGLAAGGTPISGYAWPKSTALVVGQERRGLGSWEAICTDIVGIPMGGAGEYLNAAVADSIALYEASKQTLS